MHFSKEKGVEFTAEYVQARFRQVGGIPWNKFSSNLEGKLTAQERAINDITAKQAIDIALKRIDAVGICTKPTKECNNWLCQGKLGPTIFGQKYCHYLTLSGRKNIQEIHDKFWDQIYISQKLFETYCWALMADSQVFCCCPCCGKSNTEYKKISYVTLGGCKELCMVPDILKAAKEHPMILFHSTDPQHPLYDFMYHNSTNATYHALMVATGKTHKAKVLGFKGFRKELGTSSLDFTLWFRRNSSKLFTPP
jgi:hypothetical protein